MKLSDNILSSLHKKLGEKGEDLVADFLKKEGYRIIERNYRCPFGEIDLVAREGKTVVFVEVKTRSSNQLSPPYLAVKKNKREKIKKTAQYYLSLKKAGQINCRFDIVSVVYGKSIDIEIIKRAF